MIMLGKHHSEEAKEKIREARKKQIHPFLGRHHTVETKKILSKALKGNKNFLGKCHSEETKQKIRESKIGKKASNETKQKMSNSHKNKHLMEKNGNWRGGITKNSDGYIWIKISKRSKYSSMKNHLSYVLLHRLIMAKHLGRCLKPEEVVHHTDGNLENNRIENLELMTQNKHVGIHNKLRKEEVKTK